MRLIVAMRRTSQDSNDWVEYCLSHHTLSLSKRELWIYQGQNGFAPYITILSLWICTERDIPLFGMAKITKLLQNLGYYYKFWMNVHILDEWLKFHPCFAFVIHLCGFKHIELTNEDHFVHYKTWNTETRVWLAWKKSLSTVVHSCSLYVTVLYIQHMLIPK